MLLILDELQSCSRRAAAVVTICLVKHQVSIVALAFSHHSARLECANVSFFHEASNMGNYRVLFASACLVKGTLSSSYIQSQWYEVG